MTCHWCAHPWDDHHPTGETDDEGLVLLTCECEGCDVWWDEEEGCAVVREEEM